MYIEAMVRRFTRGGAEMTGKTKKSLKQTAKDGGKRNKQNRKPSSKKARLIEMLKRSDGATIAQIMKATGWQQHSVRGFMSGTIKKKLGLAVTSISEERGRVYRIANGVRGKA